MTSNHHVKPDSYISAVLLSIVLLSACAEADFYNEYRPTGPGGWHRDSVMSFPVTISDSLNAHQFLVQLRHSGRYPFANLWLVADVVAPDGTVMYRDTVELKLAGDRAEWLGEGSGQLLHLEQALPQQLVFSAAGNYSVAFRHCMRDSVLKDVKDVGLRIIY